MLLCPGSTFESFVPTPASLEARTLAGALATDPPGAIRLLMMLGPPGIGKTHLLESIVARAQTHWAAEAVVHLKGIEVVQALIACVGGGTEHASGQRLREAALLVLDDLHVLVDKPVMQRELIRLSKTAVNRGARVVGAAACHSSMISVLVAALRALPNSRVVEMTRPRPDEMRRILEAVAVDADLSIDTHTLAAMASGCQGDVRRGIGALARARFLSHHPTSP
jgi:chromosomal replication initiator protein